MTTAQTKQSVKAERCQETVLRQGTEAEKDAAEPPTVAFLKCKSAMQVLGRDDPVLEQHLSEWPLIFARLLGRSELGGGWQKLERSASDGTKGSKIETPAPRRRVSRLYNIISGYYGGSVTDYRPAFTPSPTGFMSSRMNRRRGYL